jgi:hypothetical protein
MPEINTRNIFSVDQLREKISNVSQYGGIETSIIDNGPGKGSRIAWINTGSGFRYKVVIDRGMDIADAFYGAYSIAWLSHPGITFPQPFSARGVDWLRTFGGGLLTTCGLTHVGGPETDEFGERGLHGNISNAPTEIISVLQPDLHTGNLNMSITGRIKDTRVFGPSLELRRTISGTLGEPFIQIDDEVVNAGNTAAPHMILYHFNFGWPLADEGADLILDGDMRLVDEQRDRKTFNSGNNFKKCPPPLEAHRGTGEAAAYFDVPENSDGKCTTGIINKKIDLGVSLEFNKSELPWLTNWQHWGPGEYITGLEPCTNPPIGQAAARKNKQLIFIGPGEAKKYSLRLEIKPSSQFSNKIS